MGYVMKWLAAFVLVMGLWVSVQAEVLTHPTAKVRITVPDQWTQRVDDNVLTISHPSGKMSVAFMVLDAEEEDAALDEVDRQLEKAFKDLVWDNDGQSEETDINGLEGEVWTGYSESMNLQVECIVLDTPSDQVLAIYWFDSPESEQQFKRDINTIVRGLRPVWE